MMADLFPALGASSIPASVIGTVLVLQALEGLSDRGAAEALTFNLRWKAACGVLLRPLCPPGRSRRGRGPTCKNAGQGCLPGDRSVSPNGSGPGPWLPSVLD